MKKPVLLHIALGDHNQGLWRSFEREFQTTHYNWLPLQKDPKKLNEEILNLHTKLNPDVVFMQIQTDGVIYPETARQMTKTSITLNWTGDVRFPLPQWYVDMGREITLSLFSNMFDVKMMKKQGVRAEFLQVGFDPVEFHPFGNTIPTPKVIFMGSNYIGTGHNFPLSPLRENMVRRLRAEFGESFIVYGSNWEHIVPNAKYLTTNEESLAYRSCDIAVNLSHFDYGRYSSDRIFRLMGSGAFCLSHQYKQIENDFVINEHIATWSNIDELVQKIRYYMANIYERELIRMKGCKYVRSNCNWDVRIQEIKKMIGL